MNMLTYQVDRLREAAELYDHMIEPRTAALLREAADTIESLRECAHECASCTERQGHYLDAETIASQQAHIDRLLALNGELCAEVNAKDARIRELESLVRDWAMAPCAVCDPWDEHFACGHFDGHDCTLGVRMTELGMEADA